MLRSCSYCGRIHDSRYDCGCKPARRNNCGKKGGTVDRFRWGSAWQRKREQIRQRDNNLCQLCLRNMPGTIAQLTYDGLSVHHAVSLEEDYDRCLDDDNLLTVCGLHHEMAESGEIPLADVLRVIEEQEEKARRYPPGGGW